MLTCSALSIRFRQHNSTVYLLDHNIVLEWSSVFRHGLFTLIIFGFKDICLTIAAPCRSQYLQKPIEVQWYDPADFAVTSITTSDEIDMYKTAHIDKQACSRKGIRGDGFVFSLENLGLGGAEAVNVLHEIAGGGAPNVQRSEFVLHWPASKAKRPVLKAVHKACNGNLRKIWGLIVNLSDLSISVRLLQRKFRAGRAVQLFNEALLERLLHRSTLLHCLDTVQVDSYAESMNRQYSQWSLEVPPDLGQVELEIAKSTIGRVAKSPYFTRHSTFQDANYVFAG
eukprot:gnl/TRDRNA2_/TRDRNA2_203810_c0_seq1.p1 gnl/TRDRNA2_/TRDRNA2_203810_c0~~gnl/TRDRNA2_/TRDRNA2_203810_c0_seq1.p1  ORF type:complete len:283 (+),score=18.84 gnl/TRDRNA2_/TRDRNA2_203810_c0_seq1:75-923(+)